ncbi:MAG: class I SAM-dependent methyltransferase [Nitrospirae bacterium]|nr:class I SAM-dependent methyltransferase [Nitrospirota bacterium]
MAKEDYILRKSIKMADFEFREAKMDVYYCHPLVGIFSRLRVKHILKILSAMKGKRILDVGCEGGYVSQKLMGTGADVVSFDICFDALKYFRNKTKNSHSESTPLQAFAHAIPLKDESVDAIVCTEVIEHAPYPDAIIKELSRVIRKGGKIILTFPNEKLRKKVYGIVSLFGINTEIEKDVTMFQYHSEELESICSKYFEVISRYSVPFFFPLTRFITCIKK